MALVHLLLPACPTSHSLAQPLGQALREAGLDAPVRVVEPQTGASNAPKQDVPSHGDHAVTGADPATLLAWLQAQPQGWPGPLSLLGPPPSAAQAQALLDLGVSGWWPFDPVAMGTKVPWLEDALMLDHLRWSQLQQVRQQASQARVQLDERKWIDRAKGVLMTVRGMDEQQAFGLLRGAAMHANLRVGEVSRSVIEAAQWAEAINQAGQLRMLSQRLVKLAAQRAAQVEAKAAKTAQAEAAARVQVLLDGLLNANWLPRQPGDWPEVRQALQAVTQAWQALQVLLQQRPALSSLRRLDAAAEQLLSESEALVAALEAVAGRRTLSVVNLCGRQRMRVQRLAKLGLLASLGQAGSSPTDLARLMDEFEDGLRTLEKLPLSSTDIQHGLAAARDEWLRLLRGLRQPDDSAQATLSHAADRLLAQLDQLTSAYEHSLQVIMA